MSHQPTSPAPMFTTVRSLILQPALAATVPLLKQMHLSTSLILPVALVEDVYSMGPLHTPPSRSITQHLTASQETSFHGSWTLSLSRAWSIMSSPNLTTQLASKRSRISQASVSQTSTEAGTLVLAVSWELWETHTTAQEVRVYLEALWITVDGLNRPYLLSPSRQSWPHLHRVAIPEPFSSPEWGRRTSGTFRLQWRQCHLGLRDQYWKTRRKHHIEAGFEHPMWHFLLWVWNSYQVICGRGCFSIHGLV